ncbi:MAG: nucleoside triphosphate pyrophosphohydrolase [Bacteroidaceae bacterium]|nr:nucleoside triphosphate pyrophosphohydrolase [Bacteroidaceae bacterium]
MNNRENQLKAICRLLDVLDRLRAECPWDRKQTFQSLRPNTIEETFELCDALMKDDRKNICKELGDVLMHVMFYSKIASETNDFDIEDVANQQADKLIFRHPHIYGNVNADSAEDVLNNWEKIKLKEKDGNKTVLSGVPDSLPSLIKAYRIQDKARHVGFDWKERRDVWAKVHEEIDELKAEFDRIDAAEDAGDENAKKLAKDAAQKEFGDVLFSMINAARLYSVNPDNALELTNQKFISRFNYVERKAKEMGVPVSDLTLAQMDAFWEEAKKVNNE